MRSGLRLLCSARSYCICGWQREIIKHLAKLTDSVQVPVAQASTLWLSSEYSEHVSRIAPDDPRKMAKPLTAEEGIHPAATLNLTKSRSYCICGWQREIIKHLAKLTDSVQVPVAQASTLWLSSEYSEHVSRIAPDDPRKMAKPLTAEEGIHRQPRSTSPSVSRPRC
ncbi:AP-3 complex subunit beta-2 [Myotis brandtii]|uniref:AP-3 complex subunit beta-2 n=1 Tax=Myotis brandtii TaxID=109478 RepID=S7QFK5_MYOBR|nr:AP-3 complex subunit beta-2 [Myotis brandtii]